MVVLARLGWPRALVKHGHTGTALVALGPASNEAGGLGATLGDMGHLPLERGMQ